MKFNKKIKIKNLLRFLSVVLPRLLSLLSLLVYPRLVYMTYIFSFQEICTGEERGDGGSFMYTTVTLIKQKDFQGLVYLQFTLIF